jgi:hypothetical protein
MRKMKAKSNYDRHSLMESFLFIQKSSFAVFISCVAMNSEKMRDKMCSSHVIDAGLHADGSVKSLLTDGFSNEENHKPSGPSLTRMTLKVRRAMMMGRIKSWNRV